MLALELEQLTNKQVEVGIGDLRAIEGVIALVVIRDLLSEVRDTGGNVGSVGHACECKQLCTE